MSAARKLRPMIAYSPLPELRAVVQRRLDQAVSMATEERLEPRPNWDAIQKLTGMADAYRAVLGDFDNAERRT